MTAEITVEVLATVQDALGLPHPALVEKDFYVVRALRALECFAQSDPHLVFGGGTALCRAHKVISRMSEDIDLKVISAAPMTVGQRRNFRDSVREVLCHAGFAEISSATHDSYRTLVFELSYPTLAPAVGSLRPNVKVEISHWPQYLPSVKCSISSFVNEAYGYPPEIDSFPCADIAETAAEKFVALTRRIGQERAEGEHRDGSLVRHIYDLHRISEDHTLDPSIQLIRAIIPEDQASRGAKFPAYVEDASREIRRSLDALAQDLSYRAAFELFQRDMVYARQANYAACLESLERIWRAVNEK